MLDSLLNVGVHHYLVVAALLFVCGIICVTTRRNAIGLLMGIELILNAASLNFVAFAQQVTRSVEGHVFAIFVIILAAAEAAIALAIVLSIFGSHGSIDVEEATTLKE